MTAADRLPYVEATLNYQRFRVKQESIHVRWFVAHNVDDVFFCSSAIVLFDSLCSQSEPCGCMSLIGLKSGMPLLNCLHVVSHPRSDDSQKVVG